MRTARSRRWSSGGSVDSLAARSVRDRRDLLEPYGCNLVAIRDRINTFEPVSRMLLPFLAIISRSSGRTR